MTIKKARFSLRIGLLAGLIAWSFLFAGSAKALTDPLIYQKPANGTLTATEWNNLLNDFVAYRDGGRVGIGTATPGQKLEIKSGNVQLNSAGWGNATSLYFSSDTSFNLGGITKPINTRALVYEAGTGSETEGYHAFTLNGNEYLRIKSGGNVGIGTTTPAYKLDVSGTGRFTQPVIVGTPTATDHAATKNYVDSIIGGGSGSTVGYWTMNGTNISNSNTGNVGIGTTTPTHKLTVMGSGYFLGDTSVPNAPVNLGFYLGKSLSDENRRMEVVSPAGGVSYIDFTEPNVDYRGRIAYYLNDNSFRFSTNGIERLRLDATGNVGVGTTNPGYKLDVNGSARFRQADDSITLGDGAGISEIVYDSVADWQVGSGWLGSARGTDSFYFYQNGEKFSIDSDATIYAPGSVGIGTIAPAYKLDVSGTGRFTQPVIVGTPTDTNHAATKSYVDSTAVAAAGGGIPTAVNGYTLRASGTSWVANSNLYNNGTNVGIGTTAPGYKLDVVDGLIRQSGFLVADAATDNVLVNGDFEMNSAVGWSGINGITTGGISGNYAAQITGSKTVTNNDLIPVDPTRDIFQLEGWVKKSVAGTTPGTIYFGYMAYDANKSVITTAPCGTYCYFAAAGYTIPVDGNWHKLSATTVGEGTAYPNFPVGTKYVRVMGLVNYGASSDSVTLLDHVTLKRISKGPLIAGNNFSSSNLVNQHQYSTIYTTAANNLILGSPNNVGIGITNPVYKLDVAGTSRFTQPVIVGTPTATDHAATKSYVDSIAVAAAGGGVGAGTSGQTLRHNGTSWVANSVLYNNGTNVGIGTTNPGYKLEVQGSARFAAQSLSYGSIEVGGYYSPGSTYWTSKIVGDYYGLQYNPNVYHGMSFVGGRAGFDNFRWFKSDYSETMTLFNAGNLSLGYGTNPSDNGNRLQVSGNANFTGNIGIGTATPAYKLDVTGTGRFTQPVIVGTPTLAGHATTKSYVDSAAGGGVGAGTSGQTLRHNGTSWVANSNLYNNGINVGIGTASPSSYFHGGNNKVLEILNTNVTSNSQSHLVLSSGATANIGSVGTITWATPNSSGNKGVAYIGGITTSDATVNASGALTFATANATIPTERMRIDSVGNVGIGTTAPSAKLHVSDGNNSYALFGPNASYGKSLRVGSYTTTPGAMAQVSVSNGNLHLDNASGFATYLNFYNAGNIYLADAGGSVGVGNIAPAYKLDVTGTGRFTQPVIVGTPTATNHAATKSYVDSTAGGGVGAGTSGQTLRHNGTSWVATSNLYNNGTNVGIGTTNPLAKLQVNGSLSLGTGNALFSEESRRAKDSSNADIATSYGFVSNGSNFLEIRGFAPPAMYRTTGDRPAPYGIGFGNGSESGGIMPIGAGDNLQEIMFYGANSGPTTFTWKRQIWEGSTMDPLNSNYYSSPAMSLNANTGLLYVAGNVGIGTTAPVYTLDVSGTGRFTQPVIVGTPTATNHAATKSYVDSTASSAAGGGVGAGTSGQTLRHNGTSWVANSVLFNNGTNVGIGTTAPSGKLHVASTGTDNSAFLGLVKIMGANSTESVTDAFDESKPSYGIEFRRWWTPGGTGYENPQGGIYAWGSNNWGGGLAFRTAASGGINYTRMVITDQGNVGIGTTAPAYKLDVSGTGRFTQPVIVGTPTAPDHAITKNYLESSLAAAVPPRKGFNFNYTTVTKYYLIAKLPTTDSGTGDAVMIEISSKENATKGSAKLNVALGQRDGFWYKKSNTGSKSQVHVVVYKNADNSSNVYVYTPSPSYTSGEVSYYQYGWFGATLYDNPVASTVEPTGTKIFDSNDDTLYPANDSITYKDGYFLGSVGIGTTAPGAYKLNVAGSTYIGGALELSAGSNLVTSGTISANKINVGTIDPLYNLKGTNYASFAASVVGGVKEETTGKLLIDQAVAGEYQKTIDFKRQTVGSDLWVWYNVIDFSKDNIEVLLTPYGKPANVYYSISEEKLTFHSDVPVEVSYRLIAKRFDWKDWPTKAKDQTEKPNFILK